MFVAAVAAFSPRSSATVFGALAAFTEAGSYVSSTGSQRLHLDTLPAADSGDRTRWLNQKGTLTVILILGLTGWTGIFRLVRAEYLKHKRARIHPDRSRRPGRLPTQIAPYAMRARMISYTII